MNFGSSLLSFLGTFCLAGIAGEAAADTLKRLPHQKIRAARTKERATSSDNAFAPDYPPWIQKGQLLNDFDDETWEGTGWEVALSPDGLTLANAYPMVDKYYKTIGCKILTYTFVDRLDSWIPLDEPLRLMLPSPSSSSAGMVMTANMLALSHLEDISNEERRDLGAVHVWNLREVHRINRNKVFWDSVREPIVNQSPQKENELYGVSISLAEADKGDVAPRVAIGVISGESSATSITATTNGRVEVYMLDLDQGWIPLGKPIHGDHEGFGAQVIFNNDGSIIAIWGGQR